MTSSPDTSRRRISFEKFSYFYILSLMLLMPICELITEPFGIRFITQPYLLAAYGLVGLFAAVFNLLGRWREKRTFCLSDVFYGLLILFAAISLVFSKDIIQSCIGTFYDELPLHFMAYFALMFAGTSIADERLRKNLLYAFCAVAVLQGVVAFFQTFGFRIAECYFDKEWHQQENLAYGLTQHNNWFAGLCALLAGAAIGLFLFTDKKKKRSWAYLALSALMIYVSFCTKARIAWIANAAILFFYAVSLLIMRRKGENWTRGKETARSFLVIAALYAGIIVLLIFCTDIFSSGMNDFLRESQGGFEQFGTSRGYIWKYGLESIPDNWLTGVGLDNYRYAFFSNPNWTEDMPSQGKGHNEYLHTIVTQGVFAGINYIALLVYAAKTGIRDVLRARDESVRAVTWIYLGMFTAYAAQALVNSSVINTAMYFWIVIGLLLPRTRQKPLAFPKKKSAEG